MAADQAALDPRPRAVLFNDPRWSEPSREHQAGVIAFYYPGREEVWDTLCGGGFLGNFYEVGGGAALRLEAPSQPGCWQAFRNAEAAFQALKFWRLAGEFAGLSGNEAFAKKKQLRGKEDFQYGGYGSNWKGMQAVLHAKFREGTPLADALAATQDAFLLEHNSVPGRDQVWSDNSDGEGKNWLGLQLMLLRDEITGKSAWTSFIAGLVNLDSGEPLTSTSAEVWQAAVRAANRALEEELAKLPLCQRPGCGKLVVDGAPDGFCSRTCRDPQRRASGELRKGMGLTAAFEPMQDLPAHEQLASVAYEGIAAVGDAGALGGASTAAALGFIRTSPVVPSAGVPLDELLASTAEPSALSAGTSTAVSRYVRAPAAQDAGLVSEPVLHLRVRGPKGAEVQVPVRRTTNMRVLVAAACSRLGLQQAHTCLWHAGREVQPLHTAEVLGLRDGDLLEAEGPPAVVQHAAAQQGGRIPAGRRRLPPQSMDLVWSCPSCDAEHLAATEAVEEEPQQSCMRCGWKGYPEVAQRRTGPRGPVTDRLQRRMSDLAAGRKRGTTVATSGCVLETDFEGQQIEAPLGSMLALVTQVQRERLCASFLCYSAFCILFVVIVTLGRPMGLFFEVQRSLHQELVAKVIPSHASVGTTFEGVSDWDAFWAWVDEVLVDEVFAENRSALPSRPLEAYSRFTVGKYNRVITAVRFQQVRAKPSLPECPRLSDGSHPTTYQMACTADQSLGHTESCGTSVDSHQLARPCWGPFAPEHQDMDYPAAVQLETAAAAPPAQDLLCLQSCDAYHIRGLRTAEEWPSFGRAGVLAWVADFARLHAATEDAMAACRISCDVSGSTFRSGLTDTAGYCGSAVGKPPQLPSGGSAGCFGDAVDLPLEPLEARRRAAAMRRERWTGEGTRSVAVSLNTYNPNYDVATVVRAVVSAHPGGRLSPSVEMLSCRFNLYEGGTDTLRLLLEVLFLLWILYYIVIEISEVYVQRWKYFSEAWNYIELANLCIYAYTTISWFVYINTTYRDLEAFSAPSPNAYRDLYSVAMGFNSISLASFNLVYGFIRFTKYFRVNFQFKMLWDTLAHAMERVLPLMLIYAVLLTGFAWSSHWLFGHRVDGFQSFLTAMVTLLLSVKDGIGYDDLHDASPEAATLWYSAWFACSSLAFMNLLLTVVIGSFARVKREARHHEPVERAALRSSVKLPSLLLTRLRESTPAGLLRPSHRDKQSREQRDNIAELTETLFEVDLEALWARLLQGVTEDEVAVDAAELKFLFGGSQRKARLFINRVCNLAQFPRAEASVPRTVLQAISEVESSAEGLEAEIMGCSKDLKVRYPVLQRHLHPMKPLMVPIQEQLARSPDGDAWHQDEADSDAAEAAQEPNAGAQDGQPDVDRSASLYRGGVRPPGRGELRLAAAALDFKRQQCREPKQEPVSPDAGGPSAESSTAIAEPANDRVAIASFLEASPLKRC